MDALLFFITGIILVAINIILIVATLLCFKNNWKLKALLPTGISYFILTQLSVLDWVLTPGWRASSWLITWQHIFDLAVIFCLISMLTHEKYSNDPNGIKLACMDMFSDAKQFIIKSINTNIKSN